MAALPPLTASFAAMGTGMRAMNDAMLLRHVSGLSQLPDSSLSAAADLLEAEGQSVMRAGAIHAQHEAIGTLLDIFG